MRALFGGDPMLTETNGIVRLNKTSRTLTFYDAETGGARVTDLLAADGTTAITTVTTTGAVVPPFYGPDGVVLLWADAGDGNREPMRGAYPEAALSAAYERGTSKIVYVSPGGNDSANGKTWGSAKATIAGALAAVGAGNNGEIRLDFGTHEVGAGLSLSGHRVTIEGRGAGHLDASGGTPSRVVIKASTQSGPVLNFEGYLWPTSFAGRVSFGGFAVEGSGVADATKVNAGIRVATPTVAAGSYHFRDIVISKTGGPCLDLGAAYLGDFERITLVTPVGAKANDVPYLNAVGANGNRFIGIGFRSLSASADCGASGALVLKAGGGYAPHDNVFIAPWFEYLHAPTNGCLISIEGNANIIDGPQLFDCSKESGATGTAWARFKVPAEGANIGGNMWRGYVPGKGTEATSFDTGIAVTQSRNSIVGTKGYRGNNITLGEGVSDTYVCMSGAEGSATDAAVVDNSGTATNIYIDNHLGLERNRGYVKDARTAGNGGAGGRYYDPATPANGAVWVGTSGTRFQAVGVNGYLTGDLIYLRGQALDTAKQFQIDTSFRPGIVFPNHTALPSATSGLRGKVAFVHGGAGVADQLYVCRKKSDDTYEWAQTTA